MVRPNQPYTFATHWSTQHPSKAQQPSTTNPQQKTPSSLHNDLEPPFIIQTHNALQNDPSLDLEHSSSQDSRRSEPESNFINSAVSSVKSAETDRFKKTAPNKPYRPLHNVQHLTQQQLPSTASFTSFTQQQSVTATTTAPNAAITTETETTITTPSDVFQTTNTDQTQPQPFANRPTVSKVTGVSGSRGNTKFFSPSLQNVDVTDHNPQLHTTNEALFSSSSTSIAPTPPNHHSHNAARPSVAAPPQINLLPPFDKVHIYDDATTQGPPIYSQWKIPSSGLLPPLVHTKRNNPAARNDLIGNAASVQSHRKSENHKTVPANSVPISALKRPANGLQPPRYEATVVTQMPTTSIDLEKHNVHKHNNYNAYRKSNLVQTTPSFPLSLSDLFTTTTPSSNLIPAESPTFALHNHHPKSPTPRSISSTSNANNGIQSIGFVSSSSGSSNSKLINATPQHDKHYLELKKLLHIPDYTFPLEMDTRTRGLYVRDDSVNSFQVKIPAGIIDVNGGAVTTIVTDGDNNETTTDANVTGDGATTTVRTTRRAPWYGENAACPECHPAFVQAGSCEPCVKFRR